MELSAIKHYYYLRDTLKRLSKKGYGELSEVGVNHIFSIHYMNENGLLCTKKALYEFMRGNCHTPHKTKFFLLISKYFGKGILKINATNSYKIVSLSMDGKLLLHKINENLFVGKSKQV